MEVAAAWVSFIVSVVWLWRFADPHAAWWPGQVARDDRARERGDEAYRKWLRRQRIGALTAAVVFFASGVVWTIVAYRS